MHFLTAISPLFFFSILCWHYPPTAYGQEQPTSEGSNSAKPMPKSASCLSSRPVVHFLGSLALPPKMPGANGSHREVNLEYVPQLREGPLELNKN
jgi:hypothetical protein